MSTKQKSLKISQQNKPEPPLY